MLLVLLIIFMVITPLTPKAGPRTAADAIRSNAQADDRTVVIIIDKDKKMMINTEPTDETRLGERLMDVFKTRAEKVVFVKGDLNSISATSQGRSILQRAQVSTRSVL